jgi:hypothetical protein
MKLTNVKHKNHVVLSVIFVALGLFVVMWVGAKQTG